MQIESLGHVVIKVRDLERAEAFYNGVLGLPIVARSEQMPMTFFSLGNHHDFAVLGLGDDAEEAVWVPFDDLARYDLWEETERIIRLAIAQRRGR